MNTTATAPATITITITITNAAELAAAIDEILTAADTAFTYLRARRPQPRGV